MRTIARMALKPGMELGEAVLNNRGEVMIRPHKSRRRYHRQTCETFRYSSFRYGRY